MEADFQRYYGLELGPVVHHSPRRAIFLTLGLPLESGLVRHLFGGPVWTWELELSAATLETTHDLLRVTAASAGVKKHRLPKPLRVPRPHMRPKPRPDQPRRPATIEEVMGMLGPMMEGRARG